VIMLHEGKVAQDLRTDVARMQSGARR
jgi:hypothetical protein